MNIAATAGTDGHAAIAAQVARGRAAMACLKGAAQARIDEAVTALAWAIFKPENALELAEFGITVNAVCPGNLLDSPLWVNSLYGQYAKRLGITEAEVRQRYLDQVPMKRGCTYDDVANLVVYLASDQASYTTGQALNVTGGQEMR